MIIKAEKFVNLTHLPTCIGRQKFLKKLELVYFLPSPNLNASDASFSFPVLTFPDNVLSVYVEEVCSAVTDAIPKGAKFSATRQIKFGNTTVKLLFDEVC